MKVGHHVGHGAVGVVQAAGDVLQMAVNPTEAWRRALEDVVATDYQESQYLIQYSLEIARCRKRSAIGRFTIQQNVKFTNNFKIWIFLIN